MPRLNAPDYVLPDDLPRLPYLAGVEADRRDFCTDEDPFPNPFDDAHRAWEGGYFDGWAAAEAADSNAAEGGGSSLP